MAPVDADPPDHVEPALAQLDELPRPTSVLVENPFQLAPPVAGPIKGLTRSGMINHGELTDEDLLSTVLGDSERSPDESLPVSWFDWEIRKVQVIPEDRPPWQDILGNGVPPTSKPTHSIMQPSGESTGKKCSSMPSIPNLV